MRSAIDLITPSLYCRITENYRFDFTVKFRATVNPK